MLIGREREKNILVGALTDERSHFIAIYGRRRIGKTYLVRETCGYRFTFQHSGLSTGSLKEQVFAFEASIKDAGGSANSSSHNWLQAFEDLKDLIRNSTEKKKVIFIDELSWMDTPCSDLMPALENFWNGWASGRKDIVLIVCASATSWMMSKVIHNKGGLYNRLTEQIHLEQFSLAECEEYAKAAGLTLPRIQIMQYYMVFGGVPYYWSFLQKGLSLAQNIDRILFEKDAPLKDEFKYLYASTFRSPDAYLKIVEALGKKKVGMTRDEIIETSGVGNTGDLSRKLEELEACGFIRKYYAYGMKKKNALYQLIDFFTLFYYQFMSDGTTDTHFWSSRINTPQMNTWMGLAFERVCLLHIVQIKSKLGISGVVTDVNSWYCRPDREKGIPGAQIDLLIVRRDGVINLCEMKYSEADFNMTAENEQSLIGKISSLQAVTKTEYAIIPTLVTCYGMTDGIHAGRIQSVITMEALFESR